MDDVGFDACAVPLLSEFAHAWAQLLQSCAREFRRIRAVAVSESRLISANLEPNGVRLRHILMDSLIDYIFGPGDGSVTTWTSRADLDLSGDGVADAVRLDFDGDGRRDDAMWTPTATASPTWSRSISPTSPIPARRVRPRNASTRTRARGSGMCARQTRPRPGTGPPRRRQNRRAPDPTTGTRGAPGLTDTRRSRTPRPGAIDRKAPSRGGGPSRGASHDLDGDGHRDIELLATRGGGGRLYPDTDGDGVFDQVLIDSDGDGRADSMRRRGEPGFDR